MRKIIIIASIIGLFTLSAPQIKADCFQQNPNTGLCDSGSACGNTGLCCDGNPPTDCASIQAQQSQGGTSVTTPDQKSVCASAGSNQGACNACMQTDSNGVLKGVWTDFRCIPTTQTDFFETFFRLGTGIAGGIAFLLIIYGGIKMMLSAGNPEQLNEAREMVTSAVTGLLLIIFSVFILEFIGVNILGPSLGFGG